MRFLDYIRRIKSPFLPFEKKILDAVIEKLEPEARRKLEIQLSETTKIQRIFSSETNLYAGNRNKKRSSISLFNNRTELKFARIKYSFENKRFTTELFSVSGFTFSLITRPGPKKIKKMDPEKISVEILADPEKISSLDKGALSLPNSYQNFDFNSKNTEKWTIYHPDDLYQVELEEGSFWLLAELDGQRFVVTPVSNDSDEIFICLEGEPLKKVNTFKDALIN